jgi:hypothetical protein
MEKPMKLTSRLAVLSYTALWSIANAQTPADPAASSAPASDERAASRPSIALSPADIMLTVRCRPGQGTTQALSIANNTASDITFHVVTQDVVVREGKRSLSPAGQIANGIAANSVAWPASLLVKAGGQGIVQVTFTLPLETRQRAVVTQFRAVLAPSGTATSGVGVALGSLITFSVSGDYKVEIGPVQAQNSAASVILSEELRNSGTEPVVPKGVIVILNESGKRVAKASFPPLRILPGEQLTVAATNPAPLAPGHYHTLSSFEFERKVLTSAGEFTVPE